MEKYFIVDIISDRILGKTNGYDYKYVIYKVTLFGNRTVSIIHKTNSRNSVKMYIDMIGLRMLKYEITGNIARIVYYDTMSH